MKGYKAFDKDLKCIDFQYKENEVFEQGDTAEVCGEGLHFCENPLDTLDYYPLLDTEGELSAFAEVEALGEIKSKGNKFATNKIKIGAKLNLSGFIKTSFDFLWKNNNENKENNSDDYSQVATSGYSSKVAMSGDCSKVATSGDCSQVATSGDYSKVATSGDSSQVATSGYSSKVAMSGYYSQVATSGYCSQVATSGDCSKVATSGDCSKVATSGDCSQVATSGYSSKVALQGEYSVGSAIGIDNKIKGKKGNWVTLVEWIWSDEVNKYVPVCVKSAQIDGEILKENTWYVLKDGEFSEV